MSLYDHLVSVRDKRGDLTPAILVDEAKDPNHPLHDRFEWDDAAAGDRYRLIQAQQIIASVKISRISTGSARGLRVRAFTNIREAPSQPGVYVPTEEVAEDPAKTKIVLAQMQADWRAFQRKWGDHAEFWSMIRRQMGLPVDDELEATVHKATTGDVA